MSKLLLTLVQVAAAVAATLDVCALYVNSKDEFAIGAVLDDGNITSAQVFKTWDEAMNGIDAGEEPNLFYVSPGFASRTKSLRSRLSKRAHKLAATTYSVASVKIANATSATTSYATLQPIKGYPGIPALTAVNLDAARGQMIGSLERADELGYFVIADVFPQNGTTSKVWVDFTATWKTWSFMKYGVSTYDFKRGIYYLDAGLASTQNIVAFPLTGGNGKPAYTTVDDAWDIYTLKYSATRDSLVALVNNKATGELAYWEVSAAAAAAGGAKWSVLFSYPTGKDFSMELGQMELDPTQGSNVAVCTLEIPPKGGFAVSWVDLQAKKEIKRVVLADPLTLLADLAWCNV